MRIYPCLEITHFPFFSSLNSPFLPWHRASAVDRCVPCVVLRGWLETFLRSGDSPPEPGLVRNHKCHSFCGIYGIYYLYYDQSKSYIYMFTVIVKYKYKYVYIYTHRHRVLPRPTTDTLDVVRWWWWWRWWWCWWWWWWWYYYRQHAVAVGYF
jgi:hypothetical protein